MCLIAYRPEGGPRIPKSVVDHNRYANPDGFGLMWRGPGGVETQTFAPKDSKSFIKRLRAIESKGVEFAAHWRRATHGPTTKEMAHPFTYTDADGVPIALMHNGIIDVKPPSSMSDTAMFVADYLAPLPYGWWHNAGITRLIEKVIDWSRFLLMTPTETVFIQHDLWENEAKHGGIHYSCSPIWKRFTASKPTQIPVVYEDYDDDYGLIDDDEDDEATMKWLATMQWEHGPDGHAVIPMSQTDRAGDDRSGRAYCIDCGKEGTYNQVEGQTYVSIPHVSDAEMANAAVGDALLLT